MKTIICSTCGCSIVRLGISEEQVILYDYQSVSLFFCCQACLDLFKKSPEIYLTETSNIVVCPTCLAEKHYNYTINVKYNDEELNFCRCPFCLETFTKNPKYYLERLSGKSNFKGLFTDENICCH